jgi:hypothetical protein
MELRLKNSVGENESDNSILNALLEIFEQISSCNEICYQTVQIALLSALEMLKNKENREALTNAIVQLNKTLDKCRTASDKIDRLSHTGCAITSKILVEKDQNRII